MIGPLSYIDIALLALATISGLLAMYRGLGRELLSIDRSGTKAPRATLDHARPGRAHPCRAVGDLWWPCRIARCRNAGIPLERPRNKWAYGEASLPALAAAYAYGLARNHAFVDGNKRIAFAAMIVLVAKNGVEVDLPQPETVEVIMNLAAGALSETGLAAWIEGYTRRD